MTLLGPPRLGPLGLVVAAGLLAGLPLSCKTTQPTQSELRSTDAKAVQCDPMSGFHGICQIVEISGRLGTTTEVARGSALGDLTELRLAVSPTTVNGHAQLQVFRRTGLVDAWTINEAVDLYDRRGCIAEVNGGVFDNGFTPRLTVRVLMNLTGDGRTAFAEVTDYDTPQPVQAMLSLKCDWRI
jgi:hypothetical protein